MFSRDEYFKRMLYNLESAFDRLYPIGIIAVLFLGVIRMVFMPNDHFAYVDFIVASLLIFFYSIKNRMNTVTKLSIVSFLSTLVGLLSFYQYGLHGTGLVTLIISNLLMIIFGTEKLYKINFSLSLLGLFIISYQLTVVLNRLDDSMWMYLFNIVLFASIIMILKSSLWAIKNYMIKNIEALDRSLSKTEIILNELAVQNAAISSNKREIYQLAYYDQLTGLSKYNLFEKQVGDRMDAVKQGKLFVVDLKKFKLLNSIYGSQVGDEILRISGEIINNHLDTRILTCRLNGNEFGFWFENFEMEDIKEIFKELNERFRKKTASIFKYDPINFHISYVSYPEDGENFLELYNKVLIALNYGKSNEISEYVKYDAFMEENIQYESNLKRLLEQAIMGKAFDVHYQEKYDTKSHRVFGVEALARWESSSLGKIPPNDFIPKIRKYNMIESFEHIIIEKVFNDFALLQEKYGEDVTVGINIAPEHIGSKHLKTVLMACLEKYQVNANQIILEITEEVMIQGISSLEDTLLELRKLGFKISLDDFGSGYSSLNYLAKLPFDEIKIDKTFVDQIHLEKVQKVLKTIIELKSIYDITVIAEGVEKTEQLTCLQSIGCYMIQGYLYSKPKPLT